MYAIIASTYVTVLVGIFTLVFLVTDQTPLHFRLVPVEHTSLEGSVEHHRVHLYLFTHLHINKQLIIGYSHTLHHMYAYYTMPSTALLWSSKAHSTGHVVTLIVLPCSRTVRRLFWYLLSAILCVWCVMILKHLELESSRFLGLLLLSVCTLACCLYL